MYFIVAVAALITIIMLVKQYAGKPSISTSTSGSSAFSRIALTEESINNAKGKLTAIKDSQTVKKAEAEALKVEAEAVHEAHDALDIVMNEVHGLLG